MKSLKLLLSVMIASPLSLANADDNSSMHSRVTDTDGTTVTNDASHRDSVGITGIKKSTEDHKTVVDPIGFGNKVTTKKHSESRIRPNGDSSQTESVLHANGTLDKTSKKKKTSYGWGDKSKISTTTNTKSEDPKGLGNKQTEEEREQIEVHSDGSERTTDTKKINGREVSEEMKYKG